eukprot:4707071-Alexandrium_andersonii.AAC.1
MKIHAAPSGEKSTRPPGILVPAPLPRRGWLGHRTTITCPRPLPGSGVLSCARRPVPGSAGTWTGLL